MQWVNANGSHLTQALWHAVWPLKTALKLNAVFFLSVQKKVTVSGRFLAIDHPRDAELIDEHAKAGGPEGFLQRHPHNAALCQ
jgi:hypothetical protein